MPVDYNILAKDYDLTRTANINIINLFAAEMPLDGKTILDFGCGTGNFTYAIKKLTAADIYGVEPSDGMREKAIQKGLNVRRGANMAYLQVVQDNNVAINLYTKLGYKTIYSYWYRVKKKEEA